MGQKKNNKILLILIFFVIILIALIGFVYCYFATDILKSDKEMFFISLGKTGDSLISYMEKRQNMPYLNEGGIEFGNVNISISGQTDKPANKKQQEISVNYSEDVKFPVSYKAVNNKLGLQTKYVSNKYVAVNSETLEKMSNVSKEIREITKFVQNVRKIGTISETSISRRRME